MRLPLRWWRGFLYCLAVSFVTFWDCLAGQGVAEVATAEAVAGQVVADHRADLAEVATAEAVAVLVAVVQVAHGNKY